jgi:ribose 5-phosphate isomerase A
MSDELKAAACRRALAHIAPGQVIGLGSGSTIAIFTKLLGQEVRSRGLDVRVIPSSHQAHYLAVENGLRIATIDEFNAPDIAVDGADQIDRMLNMIKGGGGALTREKILDTASKFVVIVADDSKLVGSLGDGFPIPVEVIPMAAMVVSKAVAGLGGHAKIRVGGGKVGPVVTDNGNFVLDVDFGAIAEPKALEREIKLLTGVVEVGIFTGVADLAYVAGRDGVVAISA